jgi:hypothetical protein
VARILHVGEGSGEVVTAGETWEVELHVTDHRGHPTVDAVVAELFGPDGDTLAVGVVADVAWRRRGDYVVEVSGLDTPGRYRLKLTGSDRVAWATCTVDDPHTPLPDLAAIKTFLGAALSTQYGDAKITAALAEETRAQADACTIPVAYPASLARALKRRVQVNLAMDGQPFAVADYDGAVARLPATDPIVRRLEARWPKSPTG